MPAPTVIYDSDCGFCRWCLAKILAWDRRGVLRPLKLQSPEAERLLPGMTEEERMASWHFLDRDGRVRSAGAAFPGLLRELPGGRPLAAVAGRAPRMVDRAYRLVAGHRDSFGPWVTASAARRANERIATRLAATRPLSTGAKGEA
jgi:predicted DCC family thiol-disulfide oxidoreductase YuxK